MTGSNIVKSTQAKSKINSWFKKEYKEDNIIRGKDLISSYCKSKGINLPDIIKPKYQQIVQKSTDSVTGMQYLQQSDTAD